MRKTVISILMFILSSSVLADSSSSRLIIVSGGSSAKSSTTSSRVASANASASSSAGIKASSLRSVSSYSSNSSLERSSASSDDRRVDLKVFWPTPTRQENGAKFDINRLAGFEVSCKGDKEPLPSIATVGKTSRGLYLGLKPLDDYECWITAFTVEGLYSQPVLSNYTVPVMEQPTMKGVIK